MTTRWDQLKARSLSTPEGRAGYVLARHEIQRQIAEQAEQARWSQWHNPNSERCHGLTRNGVRCGQLAKKYSNYCYCHQEQGYDPIAEGWAEHTNPYS